MSTRAAVGQTKTHPPVAPKATPPKAMKSADATPSSKMHKRSRSGCFTCRLRRKKCDEGKPHCKACKHLGLRCEYKRPVWWGNNEQRKEQKENIKSIIKRTKMNEKANQAGGTGADSPPGLSHSLPTSATFPDATTGYDRADSEDSQYSLDLTRRPVHESFDAYQPQVYTPQFDSQFDSHHHYPVYTPVPYEVDIKTERQTYVNDIPTRRDSTVSTFSTFHPPPMYDGNLGPIPEESWLHEDLYEASADIFSGEEEGLNFDFFDFSHGPTSDAQPAMISVDDCDRPLLDHFIDHVLRLVFPILEINQHGSARSEVILPALESNKTYLHCCLSIAAIHLKSTQGIRSEQLDSDIVRHRYATISELCSSLTRDTDHLQILEATLGMIFFQCVVGRPDDCLPDIAWHQHFQAASSLVRKLQLTDTIVHAASLHPPFNMTLTAWIDILGATMLCRAPQFADTYRDKHFSGSSMGLCELMGCEDSMMYLISEISCLESLKVENRLDDDQLCSHITMLGQQMDLTEPGPGAVNYPFSSSGAIRPRQLSRNITAMFRKAARIWLLSLVPGTSRTDPAMMNSVAQFAELFEFVPSGPEGFDRSLVWPVLIAGAQSTPGSAFRRVLGDRITLLAESAEFGSFGRMARLLQEVWRRSDEASLGGEALNDHWRVVMQEKGWDFLLI